MSNWKGDALLKKNLIIHSLIALAAIFSIMAMIYFFQSPSGNIKPHFLSGTTVVDAVKVKQHKVQEKVEAIASAKAIESVMISPSVTEYVKTIYFKQGKRVKKGDLLVLLDSAEEEARLQEAEAMVVEAELQYQRLKGLLKDKYTAQSEFDKQYSLVKIAKARVQRIKSMIKDRMLRAPFDGRLGIKKVSEGALLKPGEAIVTLDKIQPIEVNFSIPERYYASLKVGLPFSATISAYPHKIFHGKIATLDTRFDETIRSIAVRGLVDNKAHLIHPGMLLKISLPISEQQLLVIPEDALLAEGEDRYVFVIDKATNKVHRKSISIISRRGPWLDVKADIAAGSLIVTNGGFKLKDGQQVKINHVDS